MSLLITLRWTPSCVGLTEQDRHTIMAYVRRYMDKLKSHGLPPLAGRYAIYCTVRNQEERKALGMDRAKTKLNLTHVQAILCEDGDDSRRKIMQVCLTNGKDGTRMGDTCADIMYSYRRLLPNGMHGEVAKHLDNILGTWGREPMGDYHHGMQVGKEPGVSTAAVELFPAGDSNTAPGLELRVRHKLGRVGGRAVKITLAYEPLVPLGHIYLHWHPEDPTAFHTIVPVTLVPTERMTESIKELD